VVSIILMLVPQLSPMMFRETSRQKRPVRGRPLSVPIPGADSESADCLQQRQRQRTFSHRNVLDHESWIQIIDGVGVGFDFGMLGRPSKTCGNGSGLSGKPIRDTMVLKLAAIWGIRGTDHAKSH
jgi:hypothetical protein